MFKFRKQKSEQDKAEREAAKPSFFLRLSQGLKRTRQNLTGGLADLFLGKKTIDAELLRELETGLLSADVGIETSQQIIEALTQQLQRKQLTDAAALKSALEQHLQKLLQVCEQPLATTVKSPFVILMVGINGAGKTTSIGKLAKRFQQAGQSVMLAAGDTFRAAAIDQLRAWGELNQIPVIAQAQGSDSASVIYDAFSAAKARGIDILIADTAGRLHTQSHLMAELEKIARVLKKLDADAPHEVMLVLDASIGQNALRQAEQFNQAVKLTGLIITKLDGTAKAGIVFAIAEKMRLPIRFIGVGEGIDDLQPFNAEQFVSALFTD